jgi:hypothetical protein
MIITLKVYIQVSYMWTKYLMTIKSNIPAGIKMSFTLILYYAYFTIQKFTLVN